MSTELTTTSYGDIEGVEQRPAALDPNSRLGTEGITANDIRLPRLSIAQGLSPQMTPGEGQYIDGLKLFDMFNDLTNEIYGRGPLLFVPVRRDVKCIEFIPRKEGGGIRDMDVPVNDPRTLWTKDEDGTKHPPAATLFHEYVILLLQKNVEPEAIVLSIKETNKWNRRAADMLATFIMRKNSDIFAGLYRIDTITPAKNDQGTFGVPNIKQAGFIPVDTPRGAALYNLCKQFHEQLQGKEITYDRTGDGADEDFVDDAPNM